MRIKNITKILMALIIILLVTTNISNAGGMGQHLLEDFIKRIRPRCK